MKQYFCVGSYLPFDIINKSCVNNSKSKQAFSFAKSKRFQQIKTNCKQLSYFDNSPKIRNAGPSIGSSKRKPIVEPNDGPSPSHYRTYSQLQNITKGASFSCGRQELKAYNYLNIDSVHNPPSTKYQVQNNFKRIVNKAPSYSLKKRYSTEVSDINTPGPARYNIFGEKNHNLQLTKYKSVSFSTGKSKRFQNQQKQVPGPGSYKIIKFKPDVLGGGNSKYGSSLSIKFPHSKRRTYIDQQIKRRYSLPGPGNYRTPSEFGQYEGNIYQQFEFKQEENQGFRPESANELKLDSTVLRRPLTSKP